MNSVHILGSFDPIRHDQSATTQTAQYSSCIQNPRLLHSGLVCIQSKPGKQQQNPGIQYSPNICPVYPGLSGLESYEHIKIWVSCMIYSN